jgi:hypothetical protein
MNDTDRLSSSSSSDETEASIPYMFHLVDTFNMLRDLFGKGGMIPGDELLSLLRSSFENATSSKNYLKFSSMFRLVSTSLVAESIASHSITGIVFTLRNGLRFWRLISSKEISENGDVI